MGIGQVYVQPGEVHWSHEPCLFKTVLGSCVAVCLWDQRLGAGGLTHFVLPRARGGEDDARFGDIAIPRLLGALRSYGCHALVAKVFGGASVLANGPVRSVGDANTDLALAMLRARGIPIVAQRTGGTLGVVITLHITSGEVHLRELRAGPAEGK
jgi:chemotaxis protein CheD